MKPKHRKQGTDYQICFQRSNLANTMQNKKKKPWLIYINTL